MRSVFKTPPEENRELQQLRQQLSQTREDLACAYGKFNLASAPELVESCIYEINALQIRSDYLRRSIKQLEAAEGGGVKSGGEKLWA